MLKAAICQTVFSSNMGFSLATQDGGVVGLPKGGEGKVFGDEAHASLAGLLPETAAVEVSEGREVAMGFLGPRIQFDRVAPEKRVEGTIHLFPRAIGMTSVGFMRGLHSCRQFFRPERSSVGTLRCSIRARASSSLASVFCTRGSSAVHGAQVSATAKSDPRFIHARNPCQSLATFIASPLSVRFHFPRRGLLPSPGGSAGRTS
jgi:hypothetical protein